KNCDMKELVEALGRDEVSRELSVRGAVGRRAARELAEFPGEVSLVRVAAGAGEVRPGAGAAAGREAQDVLEAQNAGERLGRQAHAASKLALELPGAPADAPGDRGDGRTAAVPQVQGDRRVDAGPGLVRRGQTPEQKGLEDEAPGLVVLRLEDRVLDLAARAPEEVRGPCRGVGQAVDGSPEERVRPARTETDAHRADA